MRGRAWHTQVRGRAGHTQVRGRAGHTQVRGRAWQCCLFFLVDSKEKYETKLHKAFHISTTIYT